VQQIRHTPPAKWLRTIDLTKTEHQQQTLDHFTLVLYSTLDRCLLLPNVILELGIHDRRLTLKSARQALETIAPEVLQAILELRDTVTPISDPRHFYAHRGEPRWVPVFSDTSRARQIAAAVDAPLAGVDFDDRNAWEELLNTMELEVDGVGTATVRVLDSMTPYYEELRDKLGGVDSPTHDEQRRAILALRYFRGGDQPPFMRG
jgi:hypothetical protein